MNQALIDEANVEVNWQNICKVDDLQYNSGVCALIDGVSVAIFYVPSANEKVFAVGNYDPIGKAYVLSRGIVGDLNDELVVASPLYKQHFSLRTGKCLEQDESILAYRARIDGDIVQVAL